MSVKWSADFGDVDEVVPWLVSSPCPRSVGLHPRALSRRHTRAKMSLRMRCGTTIKMLHQIRR